MTTQTDTLPRDLKKDLQRNREGRLSSRQWLELITEPLSTLLLLSVPMILLIGRFGVAGRWIVLLMIAAFGVTIIFRAIRFARVQLHYRVLYVERLHPRWQFWRKTQLVTKSGDPIRFDTDVNKKLNLDVNQAVIAYYLEFADRRVLVSLIPEKHPNVLSAKPTDLFKSHNGVIHKD